jgi:hypothetical protein
MEDDLKKNKKIKTTSKKKCSRFLLNLGQTFPGIGSALKDCYTFELGTNWLKNKKQLCLTFILTIKLKIQRFPLSGN